MDIDFDRIIRHPYTIGLLGAVVSLRWAPGKTWFSRFCNVLIGSLLAGFFSPAISEFFNLTTDGTQNAMAFATGLFGMNWVSTVIVWGKQVQLSDVLPWIRRKD